MTLTDLASRADLSISCNYVEVLRKDGGREHSAIATGISLKAGDVIRVVTGNGAGFGDPKAREPAAVAADVRSGYGGKGAGGVWIHSICHPRASGDPITTDAGCVAVISSTGRFQRSPSSCNAIVY